MFVRTIDGDLLNADWVVRFEWDNDADDGTYIANYRDEAGAARRAKVDIRDVEDAIATIIPNSQADLLALEVWDDNDTPQVSASPIIGWRYGPADGILEAITPTENPVDGRFARPVLGVDGRVFDGPRTFDDVKAFLEHRRRKESCQ